MTEFCHQIALIFVVRSKGILQFPALTFTQWTSSWTSILLNFTVCPDETKNHTLISLGRWNPTEAYFVFKTTLPSALENFEDTSVKKLAKTLLLWKTFWAGQATLCVCVCILKKIPPKLNNDMVDPHYHRCLSNLQSEKRLLIKLFLVWWTILVNQKYLLTIFYV